MFMAVRRASRQWRSWARPSKYPGLLDRVRGAALTKGFGDGVQGIVAVAELGVPIYITETGIADAKGDRRAVFLDTYVPQARAQPSAV